MPFFVYILKTSKNTLYTGQTNNLEKRLSEHREKSIKSSKYMRSFDSFELVYTEKFETRSEAMKREYELKKWTKKKKEALVNGDLNISYNKLFSTLTNSIEKFISEVKDKKSTLMATPEWSVKDELCHITFWHENYAVNYKALEEKKEPPLPEDMSTINLAGVNYIRKFSISELIKKLRSANKSLHRSIVIKSVPKMTYSKRGRVYKTNDFLEMIIRHINTHTTQVRRAI